MDDDMWTKGYEDAWAGLQPEHSDNEEYMMGYHDAESDMEDEEFGDEVDDDEEELEAD